MSNVITSPNMSIPMPIPGQDPGPDYANNQNAGFLIIDGHNHTAGKGIQITPAGLNINSNLTFQNNAATNLSLAAFTSAGSATTTIQAFSVAPASGINEAWYTDSNGVATQITKNGVVNATASSIPGESYASGTFTWKQGAGSNTPANFDIGSITLRPNTSLTTNGIQLSPPSGISSLYDIVLPALPGATSFMQIDSSGNITNTIPVSGGLTGSNLAAATVTRSNIVATGQQVSASCSNFSTSNTTPTAVTNLSVTITTTGNPVMLMLIDDASGNGSYVSAAPSASPSVFMHFRGSTQLTTQELRVDGGTAIYVPGGSFNTIDTPSAGTYTYSVKVRVVNGADTVSVYYLKLLAYEL